MTTVNAGELKDFLNLFKVRIYENLSYPLGMQNTQGKYIAVNFYSCMYFHFHCTFTETCYGLIFGTPWQKQKVKLS